MKRIKILLCLLLSCLLIGCNTEINLDEIEQKSTSAFPHPLSEA